MENKLLMVLAVVLTTAAMFVGYHLGKGQPETMKSCPEGAINTVMVQGEQYCSYMSGRYRAQVEWRRI